MRRITSDGVGSSQAFSDAAAHFLKAQFRGNSRYLLSACLFACFTPRNQSNVKMLCGKPLTIKEDGDVLTLEYLQYLTVLNRSSKLVSVQKEHARSNAICPCWHSAVEMQSVMAFVYMSKPVAEHNGDDRNQRQPRQQYGGRLLIINKSQVCCKCPHTIAHVSAALFSVCHAAFTKFNKLCLHASSLSVKASLHSLHI